MGNDFREVLSGINPDAVILEPDYLDKAIIGIAISGTPVLIYDTYKIRDLLMLHEGFDLHDAVEWNDYNILNLRGDNYPIHMKTDWSGYV